MQAGGGWGAGVGELGQAGDEQPLGDAGEEQGLADALAGDEVAVGAGDLADRTVDAEPP